uniref:Uncharacterized protein n=1 Tax=Steinernema glaseri TaxID=37863 RepID=A0A1I7ZDW6_9BILA
MIDSIERFDSCLDRNWRPWRLKLYLLKITSTWSHVGELLVTMFVVKKGRTVLTPFGSGGEENGGERTLPLFSPARCGDAPLARRPRSIGGVDDDEMDDIAPLLAAERCRKAGRRRRRRRRRAAD